MFQMVATWRSFKEPIAQNHILLFGSLAQRAQVLKRKLLKLGREVLRSQETGNFVPLKWGDTGF